MSEITFIGLGAMGAKVSSAFLENGCELTVWNRSPQKADPLVTLGAKHAASIEEAIDASSIIMICIDNYSTSHKVLSTESVKPLLSGKTVVQMSTGTPAEANDSEIWISQHGGELVAATIMVYPISIGKPEGQILVSGPESTYRDCEKYFKYLGGDIRYLGSNIGAAAALNIATLARLVANTIGIIHGVHVCESEGVNLDEFTDMFPVGDRAQTIVKAVTSGVFTVDGGASVDVAAGTVNSLQSQANEIGINCEFPNFAMDLLQRAIDAGYREEDTASLIKILRRDSNDVSKDAT